VLEEISLNRIATFNRRTVCRLLETDQSRCYPDRATAAGQHLLEFFDTDQRGRVASDVNSIHRRAEARLAKHSS